ncbi:MAG: hypothetical protein KGN84_20575, partial [Acidobacteriota bacterium]|nr:hypothetical protein [Acidobacteriota bacterium]
GSHSMAANLLAFPEGEGELGNSRVFPTGMALAAMALCANAQTFRQQANITGGDPDRGRCYMQVVVDGAAEILIRGGDATITNLNGRPPELRRFECTRPLPPNAGDFRFRGIDGRGRQILERDPRGGGEVAIRIEDPQGGADRYAFEITWRGGFGPESRGGGFGRGRRWTTDQAVEACRQAIRQQAANRYQTGDINFREIRIDDQPGRSDWVVGTLEARHPGFPDQVARFSCSVDFGTGAIRSADLQPSFGEGGGREGNRRAFENCRRAVTDRMHREGYDRVDFGDARVDDQPGRSDWITGDLRAVGRYGRTDAFRFSCNVDLRDGDVRSVDVTQRR